MDTDARTFIMVILMCSFVEGGLFWTYPFLWKSQLVCWGCLQSAEGLWRGMKLTVWVCLLCCSRVVVHNPDVTGVLHKWGGSAWDVFGNDFWGMSMRSASSHGSYRPLTILTLRLTAALVGGVRPYAFHAGNALLHALNTALLLALARRLLAAG